MDLKRREFLDLTQGRMGIEAYGREFTRLARYATGDVTNDEDKQELFRKGLNPALRYELFPSKFQSFQDLHNQALTLEHGIKEMDTSKKREEGDSRAPSSGNKKRRVFIPYSDVPRAPYVQKSSGYAPPNNAGGSNYRPTADAPKGLICFSCR